MKDRSAETSLAYHAAIADKIAAEPSLLEGPRARVAAWERDLSVHPVWTSRWRALLAGPREELLAALVRDDEGMRDLRQVTPFGGVLSNRERMQIWWRVRGRAA